jgi:hypothetical protein
MVWLRIDTVAMPSGRSHIHYQFRNDFPNEVYVECRFRSFEDERPIDTIVRQRLAPGLNDTGNNYVVGDGTMISDCDVKPEGSG